MFTSSLEIQGTLQDTEADTHPTRSEGVLFPQLRVENNQKTSSLSVFIAEAIMIAGISFSRAHLLQLVYYLGIFFILKKKKRKKG